MWPSMRICLRVQRAVGHGDAQHVGVQLQVERRSSAAAAGTGPRSARRQAGAPPGRGTGRRGRSRRRGRIRRSDTSSRLSGCQPAAMPRRLAACLPRSMRLVGPAARMRSRSRSGTIAPSTASTSIRLTSTTSLSARPALPIASSAVLGRPCRAATSASSMRLDPAAVGVEPDGFAVGQAVGGEDLHAVMPPCVARAGGVERAASGVGAREIGAGDRVADDDHDRAGRDRRGPAATAVRRACRGSGGGPAGWRSRPRRPPCRGDRPASISRAGDLGGDRAAHIDGDRRAGEGEPRPVRQRVALEVMAGGEDQRRGDAAQRQRQFEIGGGGEGRGDAGHDLDRDAGVAQRRHLLAGAAEDQRIAGLQPHDALALRGRARPAGR